MTMLTIYDIHVYLLTWTAVEKNSSMSQLMLFLYLRLSKKSSKLNDYSIDGGTNPQLNNVRCTVVIKTINIKLY